GGLLAGGLVNVFNGAKSLGKAISFDPAFLAAVALGAATTVLLATRLGAPISTTHALVGSLLGAGLLAVGPNGVKWAAVASTVALPLLLSSLLAMALTLATFRPLARWLESRSCICVTEPALIPLSGSGDAATAVTGWLPSLRIAHRADCDRGDELTRWNTEELVHWASAGLISFSRGLNDTPKIAALILSAGLLAPTMNYFLVATAMALGGLLAAWRVAQTMSQRITSIEPLPGMSANLVAAVLVGAASGWGLPVSTTHVTTGGIFGVGLRRRTQTNWKLAQQIVLAWVVTLPLGLVCALGFYWLLKTTS
ncbi:MAG: inorganic phosphate transporter, partial [Acidobacteria bacterium]|nr:inorganic phosphate transporter [Acidobacteriota bacterium]